MNSFRHKVTCGVSVHVAFREVNGICKAQTPRLPRLKERCGSELDEMRRECQEAVAAQMELQRQESGSSRANPILLHLKNHRSHNLGVGTYSEFLRIR